MEMNMEYPHQLPLPQKDQQAYTIINVCICECNSGDWYGVDPPTNHHYPNKCKQACTIINDCVFVSTIHQEMDTEIDIK